MSTETWVLYDPKNNTQSEQMTTEQMQFSLMKMKTKEINNLLICKIGWEQWQKLNSFLNGDNSPFMKSFMGAQKESDDDKPTVKMKPADEKTKEQIRRSFSNVQLEEINVKEVLGTGNQQFDADQLDIKKASEKPGLDFKNIDKGSLLAKSGNSKDDKYKLELLLINPKSGNTFRTIAKDISLSGTFSEKIIPDEFSHINFDLMVINNFINDEQYKRVKLKGKIVITDASIYIQYVDSGEEQKNLLRASLDYYLRSLKKLES